jgi:prolyl 4-hydroxylase
MKEVKNFLTENECNYIIDLINNNNFKSQVIGAEGKSIYENSRTSSTSNLSIADKVIISIHKKISNYLNIPIENGESLQGQMYEPGEYFKPHQDAFSGNSYEAHAGTAGNRTHTLMIYLNDNFEGGETRFTNINTSVVPEIGKAVFWKNIDENKNIIPESMHEGCEVTSGKKYIITSWWRENSWSTNNTKLNNFVNSGPPKLTEKGFKVIPLPKNEWSIIQDTYELIKNKNVEEIFDNKKDFIKNGNTELLSFDHAPNIKNFIHNQLLKIHEEFAGKKLIPSFIYGIRSYQNGATLVPHVDRIETHHISSIIIIDKDLDGENDWPLDIKDHNGEWHKVYAKPGDMILYEGAVCKHGRKENFKGNYFRNLFVHYKLHDFLTNNVL